MPLKQWIKSAGYAIEGVLHSARHQRHVRYHFYAAFFVLLLAFVVGVSRTEFLLIAACVIMVLMAELLNTAVEATVDILSPEKSEKARVAKDAAAGAVLVTSAGAATIGAIILYPYLGEIFEKGFRIAKQAKPDIAILALVFILITVVLLKAKLGKGHPLSGGMPSGHSALAFSAWISITYISGNFAVSVLAAALAVAVAISRIVGKVHKPFEVLAGSLLGAAVTFVLFKLFS